MNKILVIDCNYLGHRARYTTGPLSYKDKPTGVIYGFLNQLLTLAKKTTPDEVVFTWDSRKSKRKECYPWYKQGRKNDEGPDQETLDAFQQFSQLREEILPDIGFVNQHIQTGYEADDIIAALVQSDPKRQFVVATSDDDLLQLLDHCSIYNLGKDKMITADSFIQDHDINPKQWVEVKKIAGCSSDSIPGVTGVGEKTAIQYLKGNMKPNSKKYKAIQTSKDIIERYEWLVKLPLPGTETPHIKRTEFNPPKMQMMCSDLGFSKAKSQLSEWELLFGRG